MKMEGFPSTECVPRLVILAHAGIQVCCGELAWIPAFAGMTDPGGLFVLIPSSVFSKEDTKSTEESRFGNRKERKGRKKEFRLVGGGFETRRLGSSW
jgi:hypothetical protein